MICSDEFRSLAAAQAAALGTPDLLLTTVPHPISALTKDGVLSRAEDAVARLGEALVPDHQRGGGTGEPADWGDSDFSGPSSLEEVQDLFLARRWTDGLPIIPPTRDRVDTFVRASSLAPEHSLGAVPPLWGAATVAKIAANAVMAGCRPEYMPVLVAAVEAVLDPAFNLFGVQPTTHPAGPLLVINGPVVKRLGLNAGAGLFGPGWQANATLGRAVRLILINIGGAVPGVYDKATMGHPGKYTYCIAENEAASPWRPFHVDKGFAPDVSTVTAVPAEAPHNINDHASQTAEGLLMTVAGSIAQVGANNNWYDADILLVLNPEHARTIAGDGFSKEDVQRYVYEHARTPMSRWSEDQQATRFRKKWPERYATADAARTLIPIVQAPQRVNVIVAGGAGKHSMHVPTIGIGLTVTKRIND